MPGSLTESLDNLYTTTWYNMKDDVKDQIFNGSPFYMWLKANGGMESVVGGRFLTEPVRYAKSDKVQFVQKGSAVTLSDLEFLTIVSEQWRYLVDVIVRFGVDDQQNRGKNEIINLMRAKLDNSKDSLIDQMEISLAGVQSGIGFVGLQDVVADDPTTGTLHAQSRVTNTWWRNQKIDMDNDVPFNSAFDTVGIDAMANIRNRCSRNLRQDTPDIIICGQGVWEAYWNETIEQKRIVNKTMGDAGFQNIEFMGIPLVWSPQIAPTDGGGISSTNKGRMYFLNTKFLKFKYDPAMLFEMTDWKAIPEQINDRVAQIVTGGNLMTSRARVHGVIFNID